MAQSLGSEELKYEVDWGTLMIGFVIAVFPLMTLLMRYGNQSVPGITTIEFTALQLGLFFSYGSLLVAGAIFEAFSDYFSLLGDLSAVLGTLLLTFKVFERKLEFEIMNFDLWLGAATLLVALPSALAVYATRDRWSGKYTSPT